MLRTKNSLIALCVLCAAVSTAPAHAAPNIATDSAVFIENRQDDAMRSLEQADELARGDRVVTILRWYRLGGGDRGFTITNPLPRTIAYQQSSRSDELVSVDGGKTWGRLGELRVGSRLAIPEDVTHVRWRISPRLAALGSGKIAYRGVVR